MIGYWHFMKIWRKSTNISGLSDIKQHNKTKMHSFSQFKPFSEFVYFLGALSFASAVNKWNRDCLRLPSNLTPWTSARSRYFRSENWAFTLRIDASTSHTLSRWDFLLPKTGHFAQNVDFKKTRNCLLRFLANAIMCISDSPKITFPKVCN